MPSNGLSRASWRTETDSSRHARLVRAGHAIVRAASSRNRNTIALPPATTPIVRDVGVIVVGSPPKGATSNQARAAVANLSSENPGTPWTSRWLARIVSPGASSVQNAIILSVAPGWFIANRSEERRVGKECSYRWWAYD